MAHAPVRFGAVEGEGDLARHLAAPDARRGSGDLPHRPSPRLGRMTERVLVLPRAAVPGGCGFTGLRRGDRTDLARLRDAAADQRALRQASGRRGRPVAQAADPVRRRARWRTRVPDGADDGGRGCRLHAKASIGSAGTSTRSTPATTRSTPGCVASGRGARRRLGARVHASRLPERRLERGRRGPPGDRVRRRRGRGGRSPCASRRS